MTKPRLSMKLLYEVMADYFGNTKAHATSDKHGISAEQRGIVLGEYLKFLTERTNGVPPTHQPNT